MGFAYLFKAATVFAATHTRTSPTEPPPEYMNPPWVMYEVKVPPPPPPPPLQNTLLGGGMLLWVFGHWV